MNRNKTMNFFWWPLGLAVFYLVLCGYTFFMQDRLLYYPDTDRPTAAQLESPGLEKWPADKDSLRGYLSSAASTRFAGLVIVFHGNAGSAWQRSYYNEMLEPLGLRVLLAEYPGYGGRRGNPGEKSFVADAKETVRLAHLQYDGPLFLCGESLGAGVATAVAADPPVKIDGLILITPWDSLAEVAKKHYWYLPVRWLVRDRYDNIRNLAGFSGPIAMVLAERDEIVPAPHGRRLFDSLRKPKRLWTVQGASHNSWPSFMNSGNWAEIVEFIRKDQGEAP